MNLRIIYLAAAIGLPAVAGIGATIDQNWESRFVFAPGPNGEVYSMVGMGANLYVGGAFNRAGDVTTGGVARWDGTKWNPLGSGSGINGTVFALVTDGTNLFAGGRFTSADGVGATNIAHWNGTNWSSIGALYLPGGPNAYRTSVTTLAVDGTNLYAGGIFYTAGGTLATNVARWNGQSWQALGDGLGTAGVGDSFYVLNLAKHGPDLYAVGQFLFSGASGATNLARWNGVTWEQVGGGLSGGGSGYYWNGGVFSGYGQALCSTGRGLLVGGNFNFAGGQSLTNLALWDGTNWSSVGGCDQPVVRIFPDDTNQIVLGHFTQIGGIAAAGVARLSGSNWSALGQGVIPSAIAATRVGTNLFIGGNFQIAGGASAGYVARWSGADWQPLIPGKGTAPADWVNALVVGADGDLYVGGGFATVGEALANGVARYDGTNWFALVNGSPGLDVHSIALVKTNVYVAGNFSLPLAGIANLARWDGGNWVSLGGGLGNDGYGPYVASLAAGTSKLFVAGGFTSAGGLPATNLACWDGNQWSAVPLPAAPFCASPTVPIATSGDTLFVCQQGSCSFGEPTQVQLKRWDGSQWTEVGPAFSLASIAGEYADVRTMVCAGDNVFVAGHFIVTNEFFATNIAVWNGSVWGGLAQPFGADNQLSPLAHDGTNLFVAINPSGSAVPEVKIAKWNGVNWKVLGTGLGPGVYGSYVSGLAVHGRDLFVGGLFSSAGGKPANNLALWHDFPEVTLSARGWLTNGHFGLRIHGGKGQSVQVQSSTNLQSWNNLVLQLPDADPFDFDDAASSPQTRRFYRLLLLP